MTRQGQAERADRIGRVGRIRRAGKVTGVAITMAIGSFRAPGFAEWQQPSPGGNVPMYGYQIQHVYPHDPDAFTQGLQYVDGVLYEGTGLHGKSSIRRVALETGKVEKKRAVPAECFVEGITVWKNELIELTWQSHVAFVYDRATFEPKKQFSYPGEGWGLTFDGTNLIMSDGTNQLR